MIEIQPIQSLHIESSKPKRSLGLIFQLSIAIFNNHPSESNHQKKETKSYFEKAPLCKGKVKLTGLEFEFSRY